MRKLIGIAVGLMLCAVCHAQTCSQSSPCIDLSWSNSTMAATITLNSSGIETSGPGTAAVYQCIGTSAVCSASALNASNCSSGVCASGSLWVILSSTISQTSSAGAYQVSGIIYGSTYNYAVTNTWSGSQGGAASGYSGIFQIAVQSAPKTSPASPSSPTGTFDTGGTATNSYSTSFPAAQNPLSESGIWTVPSQHGDGSLWADVQSATGYAYGQAMPTNYGDASANMAQAWTADQSVTATVRIASPLTSVHEDELRLRETISSGSITGYELNISLDPANPYANIVRWNGGNGHFCTGATTTSVHAVNGDVLKGTATGTNPTTITFYLNGTQILQWADNGLGPGNCGAEANFGPWQTGSPGIGFYEGGSDWSSFGFSSFSASSL